MAAAVATALGVPLDASALAAASAAASRAAERVRGADRDRARVHLEALFTAAGVPAARLDEVGACLRRLHAERNLWCRLEQGTRASLERLRASGLRLAVVSNADGRVEEALDAAGLRDCFDVVLDSAVVGVEKPDPAIFRAALGALGVAPDRALYVGDLYDVDVVGARAAGMHAVLLSPGPAEHDCPTFGTLVALVDDLLTGGRS
jgi:putative hydrolase of the HAD superfamily